MPAERVRSPAGEIIQKGNMNPLVLIGIWRWPDLISAQRGATADATKADQFKLAAMEQLERAQTVENTDTSPPDADRSPDHVIYSGLT
jgi:hypothetical protein